MQHSKQAAGQLYRHLYRAQQVQQPHRGLWAKQLHQQDSSSKQQTAAGIKFHACLHRFVTFSAMGASAYLP
jgi:hypothetical protein